MHSLDNTFNHHFQIKRRTVITTANCKKNRTEPNSWSMHTPAVWDGTAKTISVGALKVKFLKKELTYLFARLFQHFNWNRTRPDTTFMRWINLHRTSVIWTRQLQTICLFNHSLKLDITDALWWCRIHQLLVPFKDTVLCLRQYTVLALYGIGKAHTTNTTVGR